MTNQSNRFGRKQPKGLSNTIFNVLFFFTLASITLATCTSTLAYYYSSEHDDLTSLSQATSNMAKVLNKTSDSHEQILLLEHQLDNRLRFTLIAPDGTVLSDSYLIGDTVAPNHNSRPEVIKAQQNGSAALTRWSNTLEHDVMYSSILLDNGNVLRISEHNDSILAFAAHLLFPLMIAATLTMGCAFILSKVLSRHILKPFENMSNTHTIANPYYKEFMPLLNKIEEQQDDLRNQNEHLLEAIQSRKMFIDNFSHELKTPLQIISGYSELMKEGLTSENETEKFSAIIYNETQHMKKLIEDLLSLSQVSSLQTKDMPAMDVSIKELTIELFDKLEPLAKKNHIKLTVVGDEACVYANRELMSMLLNNLIMNAIRYNKTGGEVVVSIDQREASVVFTVRDTGIGMTQENMKHIYERFYRADKSRSKETGGTGIGMAIVKHIILLFHGTINVESELGKGTIFTVELPQIPH